MGARLDRLLAGLGRVVDATRPGTLAPFRGQVAQAGKAEPTTQELTDEELTSAALALRDRAADESFTEQERVRWCALGREAAHRALGERPFDVQLQSVLAMLSGHVVQMATGEGKTLVGALAAAGYATQGRQVHLISVNDYLAGRDAEWMGPVYRLLGVSVGWIGQHSTPEQRREAYAADVTYVSANEVGFDVLRDRLHTRVADLIVPAPDVAIVDEVDSVLVDEAKVPLVLAGSVAEDDTDQVITAVVGSLVAGEHYETDDEGRNVYLTDAGADAVELALGGIDLYAAESGGVLAQVNISLHAHTLLHRDVDYIVRDGKVQLINASRGRIATLQRWPDGLQAAVELKEALAVSTRGEVLDSMTVQALIGRYTTVSGMSGTVAAVAELLQEFYGLTVKAAEPNIPCVRVDEPDRVYTTVEQKDAAIVEYIAETHAAGRPILIGTLDLAESERLAARLAEAELPCVVLNARHDAREAAIVAEAGAYGAITVSTQMAGRGTDIRLGGTEGAQDRDRVAETGGLCVIGTGRHTTSRLDDQLRGRAGRQGDPGSSVFFTSLEDDLVLRYAPELVAVVDRDPDEDGRVRSRKPASALGHAQRVAEGVNLDIHRNTWRYNQLVEQQRTILLRHRDEVLRTDLAVTGLRDRCPERYEALLADVEPEVLVEAARLIVLHHLDRRWTDHLAYLADLRESIHLHALAREHPLTEFHRAAIAEFKDLLPETMDASVETFETARITEDGIDLAGSGLRRPTATWTYLVNDNPFGSEADRTLKRIVSAFRGKRA
ncbi:accessory Sec system translocase SecA2 [Solihabitans fulvus]|uniref:Protein translocase subunit SecA n=1 Tax=Solihabitans fulvus TaxID=1892852 RepID=A0A5B2X4C5_9PSEU|nr:accessory Sec system translocase SecA2 [Solihabitans fulvus]KAA2258053.1 accessory Sec system translocase SecA2 [Solihabitans fulvus]